DLFGGRSLSSIPLKSRLTLIADGWTLNDGGDAVMIGARSGWHHSGSHPSGLYLQVSRMPFLGIRDRVEHVPALGSLAGFLGGLAGGGCPQREGWVWRFTQRGAGSGWRSGSPRRPSRRLSAGGDRWAEQSGQILAAGRAAPRLLRYRAVSRSVEI